MKKINLFYSAVIATVLSLNPFVAAQLNASTQQRTNSLSFKIAKVLHNRGIDDDVAKEIAEDFFSEDEELFSIMLKNLENGCSELNEKDILNYISSMALHRKSVKLDSYASLVDITYKITNKKLNKETLKELENIATKNYLFSKI
jgi:energy-converting hydrogenase A subunit M